MLAKLVKNGRSFNRAQTGCDVKHRSVDAKSPMHSSRTLITFEKPTCGDQPVNLPSFWEVQRVAQAQERAGMSSNSMHNRRASRVMGPNIAQ
jgi:hypothetical protein